MSVVKNQVDSKHIYCIDSKTCSRFIESTVDLYFAAMIKMTSSCISDYSKLLIFLRHDATKQSWLFIYCFAYMTNLNFFTEVKMYTFSFTWFWSKNDNFLNTHNSHHLGIFHFAETGKSGFAKNL